MTVTRVEVDTHFAMSPCFRATSESSWVISGQFKGTGTQCTPVMWLYYESEDCTGPFLTSLPDQARPEWGAMDTGGGFSFVPTRGPFSARGGLATFLTSQDTCKMDDVTFFANELATPIPTAGTAGKTLLTVLLLVVAVLVLSRR